jgi:hypothetical protein
MAQHETVERLAGDAARLQTQYEQRGQARQSVSRLRRLAAIGCARPLQARRLRWSGTIAGEGQDLTTAIENRRTKIGELNAARRLPSRPHAKCFLPRGRPAMIVARSFITRELRKHVARLEREIAELGILIDITHGTEARAPGAERTCRAPGGRQPRVSKNATAHLPRATA